MDSGYNITYAKIGGTPKSKFVETRRDVVIFLIEELNNIDLIAINDVVINKTDLVKNNIKLSRYLKLKRMYEI